jgi:hypothetical protein
MNFDDVTASGAATWNINRRMTLTANLSQDYSTIATGQSIESTSAGLVFQDSFTAKASATLSGSVGRNKFLGTEGEINPDGPERIDYYFDLSAAYFYTVNQHLKVFINYSYYRSYSTLAYAEFPREQLDLGMSSHW